MRFFLRALVRRPLVFPTLRRASRLVFVSRVFRDQVVQRVGLDYRKVRVIHHGVSETFFLPELGESRERKTYILSVSNINPHKNFETLIRAYSQLDSTPPRLMIAGAPVSGSTSVRLERQVKELGLGDRVVFLGGVSYEKLPALYRGAALFVFPSRLETFGHPLVEAMASGTPIIASDLPVCHEIAGDAALYFSPSDSKHLASLVQHMLEDDELRRESATRGKKRASLFSWDDCARKLVAVFSECVVGDHDANGPAGSP